MSLKKQVKRNLEKQRNEQLAKYEPFLKPNWQSMPSKDLDLFANLAKNGITIADLSREVQRARTQAFQDTAVSVMKVMYACTALALSDDFGFDKDMCMKALKTIDSRMALAIDSEEVISEMEERIGIRFNSSNGVERIESV